MLISCSRVYVGVHYPLDILGGGALGLFIAGPAFCTCRAFMRNGPRDV
ncbi:MAG: phosphatase PAP2 family protein [Bacillota bacterium]